MVDIPIYPYKSHIDQTNELSNQNRKKLIQEIETNMTSYLIRLTDHTLLHRY